MKRYADIVAIFLGLLCFVGCVACQESNQTGEKNRQRAVNEAIARMPAEWPKINQGLSWGPAVTNTPICSGFQGSR
jgi:hypothetical protein